MIPPSKPWALFTVLACAAASGAASAPETPTAPAPAGDYAAAAPPHEIAPTASQHELRTQPELPAAATPSAAERASLLRLGAAKLAANDAASAVIAFRQVAETSDDAEESVPALLGLGRAYRLAGDNVKSAATLERLLKDFPDHPLTPAAFLDLGRALRDLGSPKLAIARFYSVLQTAIKFPEGDTDNYRRLALTAQFEIADTHLAIGNYEEAARFFNRLNLLDLTEADRARALFKSAQARALSGDRAGAVLVLKAFIAQNPDDTNNPEARFTLATLLDALDRHEESLQVTLDLLRQEHGHAADAADRWRVWQRRTGNQLANEFYVHGEFAGALQIYRSLAALDDTPAWRLPVLYQIGLCQERLLQTADALETYSQMTRLIGDQPGQFADLARMADWRVQQLNWLVHTQNDVTTLLNPPHASVATVRH
jgi:tetratricopeptide (TPR) repeat protein